MGQGGRGGGLAEAFAPKGSPKGFLVLSRRWVVERTLSWIEQNRRMSKDYERSCASGEALVYAAMIRLMTRRLARV
jgi:putative transposase